MARDSGIVFRALSWNLYHGRDAPPDPALFTWRSRLLRESESNATHVQLNRPLLGEFAEVLGRERWDVALLQEVPPRWLEPLCRRLGASGAIALTSRNFGSVVRARLADWNPDLIASNEGGSNQLLVRPPWRIVATRRLTLARVPERRRLLWARLEREDAAIAIANLHASAGRPAAAARELLRAVEWAAAGAAAGPLLVGGDLNLQPAAEPELFEELRRRFGLAPPTAPGAIDHLLVRGFEVIEPPRQLRAEQRELDAGAGLRLRLADHAPVVGSFAVK